MAVLVFYSHASYGTTGIEPNDERRVIATPRPLTWWQAMRPLLVVDVRTCRIVAERPTNRTAHFGKRHPFVDLLERGSTRPARGWPERPEQSHDNYNADKVDG